MNKIPVWRTIGSAYSFAFGNLATVIGLDWLPLVMLLAGEYFAIRHYLDGVTVAMANGNRFAIYGAMGDLYLYRFGALLLQAVILVPIMRQALGERTKGAYVHFALGFAELRVFGTLIVYYFVFMALELAGLLIWFVLFLATALAAKFLGSVNGVQAAFIAGWIVLGTLGLFLAGLLYIYVRMSFFLVVTTVAEKKIDLIRSWTLTEGNFWRASFVLFVVGIPVGLLYVAVLFGVVGLRAFQSTSNLVPALNQFSGAVHLAARQIHAIADQLPYLYGASFLVQPLMLALMTGAAAAAYRALVPEAPAVSTSLADGIEPVPAS